MLKSILIVAALTTATGVMASPAQLTDAQYLSAVRCQALMSSPALGKVDVAGIDAVLRAQGAGRVSAVFDRADDVRSDALRQANHADASVRASLIAERSGVCQALAGNGASAMSAGASRQTGAN